MDGGRLAPANRNTIDDGMSDGSSIEWTDATWNPVRGYVKVHLQPRLPAEHKPLLAALACFAEAGWRRQTCPPEAIGEGESPP